MNCFECAKANDAIAAVAICERCGVGSCFDHTEASQVLVGGTHESCRHEIPRVKPLTGVPAGIAASVRHSSAGVA